MDKLKSRFHGIYRILTVNGNGLSYDIADIFDNQKIKRNVHYCDLKVYHFPVQELRNNELFVQHYLEWRKLAFGTDEQSFNDQYEIEQDDYFAGTLPGIPCEVTTHPRDESVHKNNFDKKSQISNSTKADTLYREYDDTSSQGSSSSDSSSSDGCSHYERYLAWEEKQAAYKDYEKLWHFVVNNGILNIPKISYNDFAVDYRAQIMDLDFFFGRDSFYYKPDMSGRLPDLGPADRGPIFAFCLLECCRNNWEFNYVDLNHVYALYARECQERFRRAYVLAINYMVRRPLDELVACNGQLGVAQVGNVNSNAALTAPNGFCPTSNLIPGNFVQSANVPQNFINNNTYTVGIPQQMGINNNNGINMNTYVINDKSVASSQNVNYNTYTVPTSNIYNCGTHPNPSHINTNTYVVANERDPNVANKSNTMLPNTNAAKNVNSSILTENVESRVRERNDGGLVAESSKVAISLPNVNNYLVRPEPKDVNPGSIGTVTSGGNIYINKSEGSS